MSDAPRNDQNPPAPQGLLGRFLWIVEKGGNALPHPATLFLILAIFVVFLSGIATWLEWSAVHPKTKEPILPVSLLSIEGLQRILREFVTNFTNFAPLGTVLVAMLGIGIAEGTGFISAAMRWVVERTPRAALTPMIVFVGVMSNVASELGYVLLVPLAATIYHAVGRNPILGLAAAFAGVSGGYSANLLLGTVDPLLAGLTQQAAEIITPGIKINPACNYLFMMASTILVTILGTFVTEKILAPRIDRGPIGDAAPAIQLDPLTKAERRGLLVAILATLSFAIVLAVGLVPEDGFLRENGSILKSSFMKGIVAIIFAFGAVAGIAYGIAAGTVKKDTDVMKGMTKSMETLGSYLVLVFFAAQFTAFFNWTNLGLIFGVKGAEALKGTGLEGMPLYVGFILLTAFVNLFMGSASAKWALMAPVFVPMFMLLGKEPAEIQCAYRIGDSCTNIISPMMSHFALIMVFMQRYDKKAGLGTLVATMLPYSVVFLIGWILFFWMWLSFDLPFGFN